MAHKVRVRLTSTVVGHKDLKISVSNDSGKLGTILISKGNMEWLPSKNSVNRYTISWSKLATLMEQNGTKRTVRRAKPAG